ncbi:MAG: hypothetical protein U1C73_18585 [Dietzia sp.]|nr:hypothetical protein [Dietzia sp.]
MTAIDGAMGRHPAGRARLGRLISDARQHQAQDVANRLLVDADAFMGGPAVPESPEVAEERMNREACALGSLNAAPRPPRPPRPNLVVGTVRAILAGFTVYVVIFGMTYGASLLGEWHGGWPA